MNYGIYGGAFDPFHNGHIEVIRGALASGLIQRLTVVPTGSPVFKSNRDLTLAPYRFFMTRKALKDMPECVVSPVEILSRETSYTIDTLRSVVKSENIGEEDRLFLICGADVLFEFEKWFKPEEILETATLMVAERPGYRNDEIRAKASEIMTQFGGQVVFFPIEAVDVSSSDIRKTLDFSSVPEGVKEFIETNDLYPADRPLDQIRDNTFEMLCEYSRTLFSEISEKRLLHSLNTAILAVRYAIRFGEDPDKAAVAGLLHDCAKELPESEMLEMAGEEGNEYSIIEMLHAPAGAQYAETRYNVREDDILKAIGYHTTGRAHMTGIDKIVYLADKLEPARKFDDLKEIRRLVETDLDAAMIECLNSVRDSLTRKGMPFHKNSSMALAELLQKKTSTINKEERMNSTTTSEKIAEILTNKKAADVEIIPVATKTIIADYFVIASGTSTTHVKALADEVAYVLKNECGISPERIEGMSTARWVLLDYKDVVVHIFHPEERANYSLEKLWGTRPADPTIVEEGPETTADS
ncbi:MAG: bis(5'-nucleosyl)-tetraphosphatase (symmetrical) YqeK [Clostridiales bacterium]|nr:bis(5'-nucleosyl)-tetraphosphatase (symmetrical) YqeK [Clostridiales bacterium]